MICNLIRNSGDITTIDELVAFVVTTATHIQKAGIEQGLNKKVGFSGSWTMERIIQQVSRI